MKTLLKIGLVLMLAISCGENGGNAPGAAGCEGNLVGSHCWYLGAEGDSCDDVCTNHGGYSEATLTYASTAGTVNNCIAVLDALAVPAGAIFNGGDTTCFAPIGCTYEATGAGRIHCIGPTTTSSAAFATDARACACNE